MSGPYVFGPGDIVGYEVDGATFCIDHAASAMRRMAHLSMVITIMFGDDQADYGGTCSHPGCTVEVNR